ncbi:ABC transporter ATP-binding protein (plasmid) [Gemmobacter fulvus]|uniref:ABC transporter ATP-binding protein n=2 Tax=Gemmobacter fulvus TaxID=2840474 RepID=A0A975S3Y3_9RHOB|nr:ABC transporter ATP-binding protein [Gemmobacter fulvus]MBT9245965.1 ABC transporter ATP-binding protein [Gemmobacter fulvus]QWK92513.1 ABC transporter ATP-binding protein [Gemmobacter fulvus]
MSKSFKVGTDTLPIFTNLTLGIQKGEFLALMGPSGSGKSTLLNILAGIDKPDGGTVRVGDANLDQMGENAKTQWRAHHVGIIFQFYNLMPMLNVADNVGLPLLLKPLSRKQRKDRIDRILELVGLTGRQTQLPSTMSGGQQQRVGIARALVTDPAVLLCDEPTGDLDRASADEVLRILRFLNRDLNKTIIMVTHDPEAAAQASRVLHLNKGSFVEQAEDVPA